MKWYFFLCNVKLFTANLFSVVFVMCRRRPKFYDTNTKLKIHFDAFLFTAFFLFWKEGRRKKSATTKMFLVKTSCIFTLRFMKFTCFRVKEIENEKIGGKKRHKWPEMSGVRIKFKFYIGVKIWKNFFCWYKCKLNEK